MRKTRTLTLYRDDSTTQIVYEDVKHFFWLAGNTVLCIAQYCDPTGNDHHYIHWPRERFCWFKDSANGVDEALIEQNVKAVEAQRRGQYDALGSVPHEQMPYHLIWEGMPAELDSEMRRTIGARIVELVQMPSCPYRNEALSYWRTAIGQEQP